jgi:AcrR family transcriptional regulator
MKVKRSAAVPRRPTRERAAQRRRTRKAIVEAAAALIARGAAPSVNDVAAAADVSRRTIYMYFPRFDQLLLDATIGAISEGPVERALGSDAGVEDVDARIDRVVRALTSVTPEVERLGRALVRLTLESPSPAAAASGVPRRGYRRIEWLEAAVAPLRREVGPARFHRLVNALAMVVGWEALIVQRDVCGLSPKDGEKVSAWAARALVRAARENW